MTDEQNAALRKLADRIASARTKVHQGAIDSIEAEIDKLEDDGFDPTKGRGRGPAWAEGA